MNTLNTKNDITDSLKVKKLMDYFLIADFSQTYFYKGFVSSLKYILQEKDINNIEEIISEIKDSLEKLYRSYFPIVEVFVTPVDVKDSAIYSIGVNIKVTNEEGIVTELSDDIDIKSPYNSKYVAELKKIKI